MNEADLMLNLIAEQRNSAMDALVAARTQAVMQKDRADKAEARVKELETELAALKPETPKE